MVMASDNSEKQKVLILGGGFGGIKAALGLESDSRFDITLLSDQENFRYYPTLYNIAVGKSRLGASIPLTEIFEGKNVKTVKAKAKSINRDKKTVKDSSNKNYSYDILIIALGVVTNFFGIKGLEENAFGIKTIEEAQRLRDHLHEQMTNDQKPDSNYVIIGGGPTGVELAGALPGYIRHIVKKHGLPDKKIHVDLIEAAPRLMPRMPRSYSYALQKHLRSLGVRLYLGEAVKAADVDSLKISDGDIKSHSVIWTAGVTNHPFLKDNKFVLNERGKACVDEFLRAEPDIYIIGDNADTQYSGMAQTALYDGVFIAENLKRQASSKALVSYRPKKPVYVTPAGPGWAAVLWGKVQIKGWLGWGIREAADYRGYNDYEPWWKATQRYMAKDDSEESCIKCFER